MGNTITAISLTLLGIPKVFEVTHVRLVLSIAGFLIGTGFSLVAVSTFSRIYSALPKCTQAIETYLLLQGK